MSKKGAVRYLQTQGSAVDFPASLTDAELQGGNGQNVRLPNHKEKRILKSKKAHHANRGSQNRWATTTSPIQAM